MNSSMTKQHFQAIADALYESKQDDVTLDRVCEKIAAALKRFNSQFDEHRFLTACGHSGYRGH